jgi:DNA-binding response OmpR family regulator
MAKARILLVEDEPDIADTVKAILMMHGYEVSVADNGLVGLNKAKNEKPDIIILDIILPGMSGFDVCRNIKCSKECEDIPVIMFSSKFQPNDIRLAKAVGAGGYITKSAEPDALVGKIKELLKTKAK